MVTNKMWKKKSDDGDLLLGKLIVFTKTDDCIPLDLFS